MVLDSKKDLKSGFRWGGGFEKLSGQLSKTQSPNAFETTPEENGAASERFSRRSKKMKRGHEPQHHVAKNTG